MMGSKRLPDGTPIPHTAIYTNGIVLDWTGLKCRRCDDGIETITLEREYKIVVVCRGCGGTNEGHGPVWRWEE